MDGKEVEPRVSYPYLVGHPAPFETRIEIRDSISQTLIDDAVVGSEVEES